MEHSAIPRDSRSGKLCEFCRHADPDFARRHPIDQFVTGEGNNAAASHLTETGYVKHRLMELRRRIALAGSLETPILKNTA
jgi:hypothetical protein